MESPAWNFICMAFSAAPGWRIARQGKNLPFHGLTTGSAEKIDGRNLGEALVQFL